MEIDEMLAQRIQDGREYRNIREGAITTRATEGDQMEVEGYATTFETPYLLWRCDGYEVWEVIDRNAFDGCDMADVIMQYDHRGHVFARISNKTLTVTPDNVGLKTWANLAGCEISRQLYEEIKGGYTTKMSFGFTVGEDERTIQEDHDTGFVKVTRRIKKIAKLFDVSAVSLPANDATEISARGYGEGVIADITEELRRRKNDIIRNQIKILSEV